MDSPPVAAALVLGEAVAGWLGHYHGRAIASMHYIGMAAAEFPIGSVCGAAREGFSTGWLSLIIIVITLAMLAIALITSVLDLLLEARTSVLSSSLSNC